MANTLSNLIPDTYAALDVVSRELVGFIPSVARDAKTDRAALNQSVRAHQTRANSAGTDITAAMSLPAAADQTVDNVAVTITKARAFPFSWSGEEQYSVDQGPGILSVRQDQIAQAIRAAVNEIENDLADAAVQGSRAYGAAGTTPFASTLGDSAQIRKILDDNGAPLSGRSLIIGTTAGAALRTLSQLTKANEAGTTMTMRDGELLNLHGFSIKESAQVNSGVTVGTGTSYVLNGSHAVGATSIVIKTGSGTVLAGDIVTINSQKYVVKTGASAAGTIVIEAPGLQSAGTDGNTVTINAASTKNIALTQNAMLLACRLPIVPAEGDLAIENEIITDPRSGLSFELRVYPGYGMNRYEIRACWGVKVIKPEHIGILLG